MSFSSRRRNYLLTPHRRDGLIEWMKSMLHHSFVLDALEQTAIDTFRHFEVLIEEHRQSSECDRNTCRRSSHHHHRSNSGLTTTAQTSRLQQLVPTIGKFHTPLPLCEAFQIYNEKHQLTKRKHIQISFNECRHILNLAQIIALYRNSVAEVDVHSVAKALRTPVLSGTKEPDSTNISMEPLSLADESSNNSGDAAAARPSEAQQPLQGPRMITFDGDQTLYSDGANFDSNPRLAFYLLQLLKSGVSVAVVTAAGYEYNVIKYEIRLSGLLHYFQKIGLSAQECGNFYLFGGECNYLLRLGPDYHLHAVLETGPGGWFTATKFLEESPGNWSESEIVQLLDVSEASIHKTLQELKLRGRVIRKKRSIGLVPKTDRLIARESLDEAVLRVHEQLNGLNGGAGPTLPYCAFNGGSDAWVDVGNKRVGVQVLCAYLGVRPEESLHIGDQFLNTGNDYAARDVCPCIWIVSPDETTYILKSILRLAGVSVVPPEIGIDDEDDAYNLSSAQNNPSSAVNFEEVSRRRQSVTKMDVYTGEIVSKLNNNS